MCLSTISGFAQYTVTGGIGSPFEYKQNLNGTGVERIFILNTLANATLSYTTTGSIVKFYKYSNSIADKELISSTDISSTSNGSSTTYNIINLQDSKGYFAEVDGGTTSAIWIVNYNIHLPLLKSIKVADDIDPCNSLKLLVEKSDELYFYTNGGTRHSIIRLYDVTYNTEIWNSQKHIFESKAQIINSIDIGTETNVALPLISTSFTLIGDQFAKHFGIAQAISSDMYTSVAVEAHIYAEQTSTNEESGITTQLGGSAPADIHFYGLANESTAYFYTWYIYNKEDLKNAIVRYTDKNINYIFDKTGNYIVTLEVADKNSICIYTDSVSFSIDEYSLKIPNILVLDGTHEFKVTANSIVKFKCTIFNRWGNKIYEWTDPFEGWDGKYNGNYVSPGVYFYVIVAEGADGKKHKKAGDINVLRKK